MNPIVSSVFVPPPTLIPELQLLPALFATGEGRKDGRTARISGRARDNRVVHVAVPVDPAAQPRPGDIGEVEITYAAPHHLVADAPIRNLRRTPGGDAWQAEHEARPVGIGLGLPVVQGR